MLGSWATGEVSLGMGELNGDNELSGDNGGAIPTDGPCASFAVTVLTVGVNRVGTEKSIFPGGG